MQEIKLTQKQKIDNAIAALVDAINGTEETDQPKKERWFKCLNPNNYHSEIKPNIPYRESFAVNDNTHSIGWCAEEFPKDWQEVTPDYQSSSPRAGRGCV